MKGNTPGMGLGTGASAPPPAEVFGYHVIDCLGEGAGSTIYAVSDPLTHQLYALKHVVRRTDKDARFVDQLEAEHAVSQQFQHPALRRSFQLKLSRTLLRKVAEAALLMELFDGQPLEVALPNSLAGVVDVFIHTARGLEALHGLGYVHCDLKPNNILLQPSTGHVKVIDFGQTCRAGTAKRRVQGTPDFIAPEQVRCEPVTVRTDVFNFGATLYWALTGRKLPTLFTLRKGQNSFLLDDAMAAPSTVNPVVPEPLSRLVMECVRTSPSKRPQDMGEITRRLDVIHHAIARHTRPATSAAPPSPAPSHGHANTPRHRPAKVIA